MSWATMRTRSPSRRTLPSSTAATSKRAPISRRLCSRCLSGITDVLEMTLRARIFDSWAMMSSVIPSAKYAFSGSGLRFVNGSTAMDLGPGRTAPGCASASANAAAEANRSAGTVARALRRACSTPPGTVARRRRTPGAGPARRLAITAWAVGPVYGGSPTSSSYRTQARLVTSLRASSGSSPRACSGLMYSGVPTQTPRSEYMSPEQDVLRLDVPMDHPLSVGVAEGQGGVARHGDGLLDRKRLLAVEPVAEGLALHVGHDVEGELVSPAGVVQCQGMGGGRLGGGLDL